MEGERERGTKTEEKNRRKEKTKDNGGETEGDR
jgi:hypothetical protein